VSECCYSPAIGNEGLGGQALKFFSKAGMLAWAIGMALPGSSHAQGEYAVPVNLHFVKLSDGFFERVGIDINWNESEHSRRAAILSDIEAYFLLPASGKQGRHQIKPAGLQLEPGKWALHRTPRTRSQPIRPRSRENASRQIGIKLDLIAGSERVRVETCEIENDRFIGSTSSCVVLQPNQVALVPIRRHEVILVRLSPGS